MRALSANDTKHFYIVKCDLKHTGNMFARQIGCVPFCNSGRLTLSDEAF